MYVATTYKIPNKEINKSLGLVVGTAIYSMSDGVAGDVSKKGYLISENLKIAEKDLISNAEAMGANAVIGVTNNITTSLEFGVMITLTGTAVVVELSEEEQQEEENKIQQLQADLDVANQALDERNQLLVQALSKIESLERAKAEMEERLQAEMEERLHAEVEQKISKIEEKLTEPKNENTVYKQPIPQIDNPHGISEVDVKMVELLNQVGKPISASNLQEKVPEMTMLEVLTVLNKLVEQQIIVRDEGLYSLPNRPRL